MALFRKKPVVIEAWRVIPPQLTGDLPPTWLVRAIADKQVRPILPGGGMDVVTLEGTMRADVGDWIIQCVKGELYPCKPAIFAMLYEPV